VAGKQTIATSSRRPEAIATLGESVFEGLLSPVVCLGDRSGRMHRACGAGCGGAAPEHAVMAALGWSGGVG
jgi:hypothetical protein